jgi:pimeloyl-ACP methyl ester carboxylesterase
MHRAAARLLIVALALAAWLVSESKAAAPHEIALGDCLVLPAAGRSGRSPIHLDAVEALLVVGKWKAPKAGDTVTLPDGKTRTWTAATAKDGTVENAALQGGYAFWSVNAEAPRVMLLEASGQFVSYVNGEPRGGDPYQYGTVRLPVLLRAGDNELLFQVGRGRLHAKLVEPEGPATLDARDATLPDYREGEDDSPLAALVVVNASEKPLDRLALRSRSADAAPVTMLIDPLPPLSTRKAAFRLPARGKGTGDSVAVEVDLLAEGREMPLATTKVNVRVRRPAQSYKRTFISDIDGSVQYFAVQPADPGAKGGPPALVLTLHGAGVEAIGQADAYHSKPWCHIVAPTNRRPYGFDWEDWGRLDALEVLALAKKDLKTDPRRTYLTGHSMGGHGTWQLGVTFPDQFAAIAPSAGWISFATYAGGKPPEHPTPMQAMLRRAASPGETLTLERNLARDGVYVLHGDADDNVPVSEARAMRKELGGFHADFVYYERPGAGHWWGGECVDWPPLFDFLQRHTQPQLTEVRRVDFVTASPGVSSRCDWAEIAAQAHAFLPSHVRLTLDPEHRAFSGTTENVTRLGLDCNALPSGKPVRLELDGQSIEGIPWPAGGGPLWLGFESGKWKATEEEPAPSLKGPHRYGPFKDAFRNRVLFVYGTKGTAEENAWSYAKARFDAETFWYRGNGSVELRADVDFDAKKELHRFSTLKDLDRNVVLYGHAESNAAWQPLLGDSSVQVRRGVVRVGDREEKGDDLACLFVRPRPGSDRALVGAVSGTGLAGLRLTDRMPYFVSGVGYPDCTVLGPDTLTHGAEGVRAAGFFGMDWGVASGEWVWRSAAK